VSDTSVIVPPKLADPWGSLLFLECSVSTELRVPNLTVNDILRLQPGSVLNTEWRTNRDLPLRVNGRLLGFTEFDSAGETMGVRITEFAWEQQR
jgi:flagellar motor switch/type III secretory pathway protein FliN